MNAHLLKITGRDRMT